MAYNPDEARDGHGRWTAGGASTAGTHDAGPAMAVSDPANRAKADNVARVAADVAGKMGFDPGLIQVTDKRYSFELNGKTVFAAGVAYRPPEPEKHTDVDVKGTVDLFVPDMNNDKHSIEGVVSHEVMHQMFNQFRNDYRRDYLKLQEDPEYKTHNDWKTDENGNRVFKPFMKADGLLNEPHASKYPIYQAYTKAMMPMSDEFAKSDGVSEYSREYWKGYQDRTIGIDKPYHETLAEIARLRFHDEPVVHYKLGEVDGKPVYFSTVKKGIKPVWNTLYKAVVDNWKRHKK